MPKRSPSSICVAAIGEDAPSSVHGTAHRPVLITEPASTFGELPVFTRQSTSKWIADRLREAIIQRTLLPGTPLRQEAIAKQFAVSAIPVREALRLLESENWVTIELHRGASVALQSAEEAREIYEIRAALERLAIGLAGPHHTVATLADCEAALTAANQEKDPGLFAFRNEQFHIALYRPADRPQLFSMLATLHRRGERYLRLKLGFPSIKSQSDREHEAILTALRAGDMKRAQQRLSQHLLKTGELLYDRLKQR
jgi:DNA-binding GntR family transcriptional regulator